LFNSNQKLRVNFYLYIGNKAASLEFRLAIKKFPKDNFGLTDKNFKGQGQFGQEGGKERKVTVDLPFI
jgi:hypothetical protein